MRTCHKRSIQRAAALRRPLPGSMQVPTLAILAIFGAPLLGCATPNENQNSTMQREHSAAPAIDPIAAKTTSIDQAIDPEKILRGLASNPMLRLSNELADSPTTFHFALQLSEPIINSQGVSVGESTTVMDVACIAGRVSILCLSKEGLPYALLKDHLLIAVDGGNPGGLMMFDRGAPVLRLKSKSGERGFDFDIVYHSEMGRAAVTLDLCSIIAGLIHTMQRANFDSGNKTIAVESPNSTTSIILSDDKPGIPIREFSSRRRGTDFIFRIFDLGIDSSLPFDPEACNELSVRSLRLPISVTDDPTADSMDFMDAPDFDGNLRESEAAVRLARLIHLRCAGD